MCAHCLRSTPIRITQYWIYHRPKKGDWLRKTTSSTTKNHHNCSATGWVCVWVSTMHVLLSKMVCIPLSMWQPNDIIFCQWTAHIFVHECFSLILITIIMHLHLLKSVVQIAGTAVNRKKWRNCAMNRVQHKPFMMCVHRISPPLTLFSLQLIDNFAGFFFHPLFSVPQKCGCFVYSLFCSHSRPLSLCIVCIFVHHSYYIHSTESIKLHRY